MMLWSMTSNLKHLSRYKPPNSQKLVLDKPGTSQKGVYIALLCLHSGKPAWHLKILFLIGNTPSNGLFSIAMLVYHRVMDFNVSSNKKCIFFKAMGKVYQGSTDPQDWGEYT